MNNNNNNSNDNTSSNLLQHTNNPFSNLLSSNASTGGGSVGGGSVGVGGVGVGGGIGLGIGIGIGIGGLGGNNNNVGGSIIGGVGGVGSIIGGAPGPGTGQASGQGQVQNQGQGQVQQGPSSINMPSMASMSTITAGSNSINNNANLFGLNNLGGGVSGGVGGGIGLSGGGIGVGVGGPAPSSGSNMVGGGNGGNGGVEELLPLVIHLTNPEQREGVLLELSKKRESFPDLAPILWHTYGTVAALLQEIVSIYPLLSPPTLTAHASNRVCNALALLQCVASHPDTRSLFLSAHVPLYLYPFLNTQSKSRPFEYLRLTSLGVVGALVKMDDPDVINFLLQTEIIPLCLRIMETGSELSKTVATFIVQKILLDEIGLSYVCATAERFYAVSTVLNNMIGILVLTPSVRLLKHIVRCYLRLSDNVRAREALRQCLPMSLRDETFGNALRDDVTVKKWLSQLLSAVGPPMNNPGTGGGMMDASNGPGGLGAGVSGGLGGGLGGAPGTGNLDLGSS